MFDIIVAMNNNRGIGYEGKIPWENKEDKSFFRKLTDNSILIVGRKTFDTLPDLKNRTIFVLSKSVHNLHPHTYYFSSLNNALDTARILYPDKKVYVIGGEKIYNIAINHKKVRYIYLSKITNDLLCDTFFPILNREWVIIKEEKFNDNSGHFCILEKNIIHPENQYIDLLRDVMSSGKVRNCRNGETRSVFFRNLTFDLREGFPLLTTKKMFFRGIVEELLFFIRGQTNTKILENKGINIWKGNTNREFLDKTGHTNMTEGLMGPMYGYQWRFFNAEYDCKTGENKSSGIDQLQHVIDTIKNEPESRRILLTDFNPLQANDGVLYPCHSIIIQFYVDTEDSSLPYLDIFCYNRSQDLFLGTPFNIASTALLLCIIAKITGCHPRFLYMSLGDVHIYKEHYDIIETQLHRELYKLPTLVINNREDLSLHNIDTKDIMLKNYLSHPAIKAEMKA